MRIFARDIVALLALYLTIWTLSYVFMFVSRGDGLDFSHYFEYLTLAWTFRAGELPSFIWLISVVAFVPLGLLMIFQLRKRAPGKRALEGPSDDGSRHI